VRDLGRRLGRVAKLERIVESVSPTSTACGRVWRTTPTRTSTPRSAEGAGTQVEATRGWNASLSRWAHHRARVRGRRHGHAPDGSPAEQTACIRRAALCKHDPRFGAGEPLLGRLAQRDARRRLHRALADRDELLRAPGVRLGDPEVLAHPARSFAIQTAPCHQEPCHRDLPEARGGVLRAGQRPLELIPRGPGPGVLTHLRGRFWSMTRPTVPARRGVVTR
jgi:hypothetical protein